MGPSPENRDRLGSILDMARVDQIAVVATDVAEMMVFFTATWIKSWFTVERRSEETVC